jgi:glucosyl-dolichyl phosphate glucuronosyltransferase
MARPNFSVILCTRNRAHLLGDALASIGDLAYPAKGFELVLVDNDSADATAEVVARFARQAPFEVRHVLETRIGLSAARNRGIREARGRLLFFTDDDQIVDGAVLTEHERVIETYGLRAVQGRIELTFPEGRPPWLRGDLATMLGETRDCPEGPCQLDLYGGNLAFHRELFDEQSAFREDLGKGAAGYSEDLELTERLRRSGEVIGYAPTARVYHVILADRSTPAFFRRNAFQKGYSDGIAYFHRRRVVGAALKAVGSLARAAVSTALARRHESLLWQTRSANQIGRLYGYTRARTGARA